jgi:uncharacterized membrane protein SpoIIM required for sporulation
MEFFLKKDVFKRIAVKHILFQLGIIIVLSMLLYTVLGSFEGIYYVILPLVIIYELIKQIFVINKMKKEWDTYRLLFSSDSLYKTQYKNVDKTIMRESIRRVIEIPNSGLSVQTIDASNYIFIPKTLENYELCRGELAKWCPIEESPISLASLNEFFKNTIKGLGFFFGGIILLIITLFIVILLL